MKLQVERLSESASLPEFAHPTDAGADLRSNQYATLRPGETQVLGTGISIRLLENTAGYIQSRSGLAAKHNVFVLNSPGLIDQDYRGELNVILTNLGKVPFDIMKGDRIAQLVILELPSIEIEEVEAVGEAEFRNESGLGSTGVS